MSMPGSKQERRRRGYALAAIAGLLFIAALGAAALAWGERQVARSQERIAEARTAQVQAQQALAQAQQAHAEAQGAAAQAFALMAQYDPVRAMAVAYQALPQAKGEGWPDVASVRAALMRAYAGSHLIRAYDRKASAAALSSDGTRLAMAVNGGVEIRSIDPDALLVSLVKPAPPARSPGSGDADSAGELIFLDLAPDGQHVLAASDNDYWLWSLDTSKAVIAGSCADTGTVNEARFIGQGENLLIKCGEEVRVLAVPDLHSLLRLAAPADVSGDGRMIATATDVRSIPDGKILLTFPKRDDAGVPLVAFDPDGKLLAIGEDKTVALWEVANVPRSGAVARAARPRLINVQTQSELSWLGFSPDGKTLVTVHGPEIRLWDAQTAQLNTIWSGYRPHPSTELHMVDRVHMSRDGRWLLAASNWIDGMVSFDASVWNPANTDAEPVRIIRGEVESRLRAFSDGPEPIFATVDRVSSRGGVFLWSAEDPLLLHRWPDVEFEAARTNSSDLLVKSKNDGSLASCRIDTFVCKPASASAQPDLRIETGGRKVVLSLQGQALIAYESEGFTGWRHDLGASTQAWAMEPLDDGSYVLAKAAKTAIALRTLDGQLAHTFEGAASVTPLHGPTVLVGKAPNGFDLFDLDTGQSRPLSLPEGTVEAVAVTRNGTAAAIVTRLGQKSDASPSSQTEDDRYALSIVSIVEGGVDRTSELAHWSGSIEFSADGHAILIGERVIDAKSGDTLFTLAAPTGLPVYSSRYSPDRQLIFASYDAGLANPASLRIFLARDGTLLTSIVPATLSALQFSQDGKFFAVQDPYDGLCVLLTPSPAVISARVRQLLEPAGLLTPN